MENTLPPSAGAVKTWPTSLSGRLAWLWLYFKRKNKSIGSEARGRQTTAKVTLRSNGRSWCLRRVVNQPFKIVCLSSGRLSIRVIHPFEDSDFLRSDLQNASQKYTKRFNQNHWLTNGVLRVQEQKKSG